VPQTAYERVTRHDLLHLSRDRLFVVLSHSLLAIASMGHVVAHSPPWFCHTARLLEQCEPILRPIHILTLRAHQPSPLLEQAVLTGPRPHIFAAVTSSEPKAHGGEFLRRNLARELQAQIGASHGDVLAAFR
jgi:hypothetical protein